MVCFSGRAWAGQAARRKWPRRLAAFGDGKTQRLSDQILPGLAIFGLLLLFATGGVQASGFLPLAGRPAALRGSGGIMLVGLLLLALLALLAAAIWLAGQRLSWPVAVVAGGLGLLGGPLAFQALPRDRLDRPLGVGIMVLVAVGVAGLAALSASGQL